MEFERVEMIMLVLMAFSGLQSCHGASMACQEVRYAYSARGINVYDVPLTPQSGVALQICPKGPTCCTPDMEERLGDWSAAKFKQAVEQRTDGMSYPFKSQSVRLDDFVGQLLVDSQRQFHKVFTETYGILYERNAFLFRDFFQDLRKYYQGGKVNLHSTSASFFTALYQKMFQVMNNQYHFDEQYMKCVAEKMDHVMPFGTIPKKLGTSVKRSMVAVRALVKALKSGFEIAHELKKIPTTKECLNAVQRMNSCPACQGLPDLKPCSNYCINVIKGCLAFHFETQELWDKFIDAIMALADRLVGPFNVEQIILPLDISISDAIMNFQESGFKITQEVFKVCGTPRLMKRSANDKDGPEFTFDDEEEDEKKPFVDFQRLRGGIRPQRFEKQVQELRRQVRGSQGFWKHLPYTLCASSEQSLFASGSEDPDELTISEVNIENEKMREKETNEHGVCWNGVDSAPYKAKVVEDGLTNQVTNPEVPLKDTTTPAAIKEQMFRLQAITNQLKIALRGQDVEWWETSGQLGESMSFEGSGESYHDEGSGGDVDEGSGDVGSGTFITDDEDLLSQHEGPWKPWNEQEKNVPEAEDDSDDYNEIDGVDDPHPKGSGGPASIRKRFNILTAITRYLLPAMVCYISSAVLA